MKKSHFFAIAISALFLTLFSTVAIAQQKTLIGTFNQGTYLSPNENPPALFGGCSCGEQTFNCICGFVDYTDVADVAIGQIPVVISSQVVSGNTLQIKFQEKLKMELKTNDFVQKEAVVIKSDVAKSLGYKFIKILPGKYTIKDDNSLTFNIERGEPYQTRGWGWLVVVIIVIIVWGVGGGTLPSTGSNGGVPSGQGCDFCKQLPYYWAGLSPAQRIWMFVWYFLKRAKCRRMGC